MCDQEREPTEDEKAPVPVPPRFDPRTGRPAGQERAVPAPRERRDDRNPRE